MSYGAMPYPLPVNASYPRCSIWKEADAVSYCISLAINRYDVRTIGNTTLPQDEYEADWHIPRYH